MIGKRFLDSLEAYVRLVHEGQTVKAKGEAFHAAAELSALLHPTAFKERDAVDADEEPWPCIAPAAFRLALEAIADSNAAARAGTAS